MIERFTFNDKKISYSSPEELQAKINQLRAREIISIKPTTPEATDAKSWVSVYYSIDC